MSAQGIVLGMDEVEYHAHPALSSTGARELLTAPAKFAWSREHPRPHVKVFDVGASVHARVLGTGWEVVEIPDALLSGANRSISSAEAKQWVRDARAAQQIPLKSHEIAEVNAIAESVLAHKTARMLLEQEGHPEASVFSVDPATGVECRARFDFLPTGQGRRIAVDLKTKHGEASAVKFSKSVADLGYHVQEAHYIDTLRFADEYVDAFAFLVVEKEPPYLVATFVLNDDFREIGAARAARARDLFARGIESGVWPGYPDEIQIARPPQWAVYDHIDSTEAERAA